MKPLSSSAEFGALLRPKAPPVTNCFLLPGEIDRLAAKGLLFYEADGENRYFYEKRNGFYRLHYYVKDSLSVSAGNMPVACELIGSAARGVDGLQKALLEKDGFSRSSSALRAALRLAQRPSRSPRVGFEVDFALESEAEEIGALWRASFDRVKSNLPDQNEIASLARESKILLCRDGEGRLAGALLLRVALPVGEIKHVAVRPELFGRGVGRLLESEAGNILYDLGVKTAHVWVLEEDAGARAFHEKMGYRPDGRISEQYFKR